MLKLAQAPSLLTVEPARGVTALLLYASAIVYAGIVLWRYPRWAVDDAYIVFRYAKHLVDNGQLTWTVGSDPVEGYTGIALPLLVAAGMRAGIAPQLCARIVGCVSYFVAAWTLRDNQRRLDVPEPVRAYVTATAMIFPAFFVHATSGLETMPFAAMLGVCFGALLACDARPTAGAQARLWVGLLVLTLIRPEGLVFAAVFGGALVLGARRHAVDHRRTALLAAVGFVLPYGAYFLWRATYYGRLWPNTYYAKSAAGGFDPGFLETAAALGGAWMPLLAAIAVVVLLLPAGIRLPRLPIAAALAAVGLLAVQYSRSALVMGYLYRFQFHCLLVLLPLAGVLLANVTRLGELVPRYGRGKGGALIALVGACLVAWPAESVEGEPEGRRLAQRYLDVETDEDAPTGAWLRDHLPPSEPIACWVDAGMVPFLADHHAVLDFGKLNDVYLARPGISRAMVADYFFAKRPGALVIASYGPTRLVPVYDGAVLTDDPRFADYERVRTRCSPRHPEAPCEVLFLRRGVTLQ